MLARDPNASNAAPAQPGVIYLEPEPEAMELSPSIAPTSPLEVMAPIEVEPPVTGGSAQLWVQQYLVAKILVHLGSMMSRVRP